MRHPSLIPKVTVVEGEFNGLSVKVMRDALRHMLSGPFFCCLMPVCNTRLNTFAILNNFKIEGVSNISIVNHTGIYLLGHVSTALTLNGCPVCANPLLTLTTIVSLGLP